MTYDRVASLIFFTLEVEVMVNCKFLPLLNCTKNDLHVELAPSFFLDDKWRGRLVYDKLVVQLYIIF